MTAVAADARVARIVVRDESDLVVVRRWVRELGPAQGLSAVGVEALATAITEIAHNMVAHGGGGEVLVRAMRSAPRRGLVATARDSGPGIVDVARAMCDGYSTGAGLGLGLPSARRLVDEFEIESTPGAGTTITLRKWSDSDRLR